MKITLVIIVFLLQLVSIAQSGGQNSISYEIEMEDIRMRKVGDSIWMDKIKLPNSIHQILYEKSQIPNPYFGDNEKSLKWVEETNWEIEGSFYSWNDNKTVSTEIIFNQIEPFTEVYINDVFLFESHSSFIPYQFEILHLLKEDDNRIRFICKSPVNEAKKLEEKNKLKLPGEERVYIRKPQYEFGWDWGPRFATQGINDRIMIVSHPEKYVEFRDVHVSTQTLDENLAILNCKIEIYSDTEQTKILELKYDKYSTKNIFQKKLNLKKGINYFNSEIKIEHPQLWWPQGMGEQYIYPLTLSLNDSKKKSSYFNDAEYFMRYAICEIKLIQEKDSIGKSFYFNINGKPVYLKGFNLIPSYHLDNYLHDSNNKISNLFDQLVKMNCNAVRIWGGGNYLKDYEISYLQERGIIVWQDFMFAGGMYPGDSSFLKNAEEEITYQVKRLRNYNNIALYCGNNEIDEAWHNWGWQKQFNYSKEDSTKIWNDYLKLFHELIPSIVKKYDPDTDYIPSSPEIGWGRKESMTQGDSHYWGVWWGKEPIETFEEKIPRFMSEFGMQAMPDLSTLRKVIPDSLMNFNSLEFKNHQKHPTGFETLNYYLEKYLTIPTDMEDYVYATQLLQAITLEKAIKAQRMSEKCMGTLIWQLNDTWPVTSWSVIDSEGKKKLAFDYVQKSFADAFFHLEKDGSEYHLYLLNESQSQTGNRDIKLTINDFPGNTLLDTLITSNIEKGKNEIISFTVEEIKKYSLDKIYLTANCNYPDAFSVLYFEDLNQIKFLKPNYKSSCKIEDYLFTKHGKIFSKHYEVTLNFDQDLHFPHFIDTDFLQNDFPEILKKGKGITVNLPYTDFINEQAAIDYVKKNLKSINHLLGK